MNTETIAATTTTVKSALPGVNVLLMGPAGTGKTHSIGTLVDAGVETFYMGLEPGLESLLGYWTDKGKEVPSNLHWHVLEAPKASFNEFLEAATRVNTMNLESLAKMADPKRSSHNQFIKMITAVNDFPDDRTGAKFGCVDTWGPDKAFVVDGLGGVTRAAMALVVGGKAVKSQMDWGIAQDQVPLCTTSSCGAGN